MLSAPPSYYAGVYAGDIRYVASTGRLLHGNSGLSSQEIVAFKLTGNDITRLEETGTYGSAQGYGGTTVLATDGSVFYYGRLQVDALDVRNTRRAFPETIHAASATVAFGSSGYYDATTGQLLGTLGFSATVYALNPNGQELWVYDAGQSRIRRFVNDAVGGAACGSGNYPFPYVDVAGVGDAFCPGILQAYVLGVTKGTSPTTFSPSATVSRDQMTTFLQRSFDQASKRASRRAALGQWWSVESADAVRSYTLGGATRACASDGEHVWLPVAGANQVAQVQASTGRLLGTWTGAISAGNGVLVAAGRVFVSGQTNGALYALDPSQPPGLCCRWRRSAPRLDRWLSTALACGARTRRAYRSSSLRRRLRTRPRLRRRRSPRRGASCSTGPTSGSPTGRTTSCCGSIISAPSCRP
jgi:hypothetical protein